MVVGVVRCLVVTTKTSYSMLLQAATLFFKLKFFFFKSRKFLDKRESTVQVFINKFMKIWSFCKKLHIFGKRKLQCIFLCKKNATSIFLRKIRFSKEGSLTIKINS